MHLVDVGGQSSGLVSDGMDSNASPEDVLEIEDPTEWEYEHDDNETEDFYFTVDITKHEPAQPKKTPKPKPKANGVASTASTKASNTAQRVTKPARAGQSQVTAFPNGRVEFLSLHSADPLLRLDEQLYSCNWSTDLGTQVHVARSGTTREPLRSGRVLDVVSTTRARLIAKPHNERPQKEPVAETITMSGFEQASKTPETGTEPRMDAIKSFREQLNDIKMKKSASNGVSGGTAGLDPP